LYIVFPLVPNLIWLVGLLIDFNIA